MRTTSQNFGVIEFDGVIAGISLGADYCAEHEWGFRWGRDLGIADSVSRECYGIEARRNTKCNLAISLDHVKTGKGKSELVLIGIQNHDVNYWNVENLVERFGGAPRTKEYSTMTEEEKALPYSKQPLADIRTSWSDSMGFMVIAQTPRGEEALRVVYNALLSTRCAIGYGSSANPFTRAGINMIDIDMMPEAIKERIAAADIAQMDLIEAAAATGIEQRLKAAGKQWFALKPRLDSATGEIIFWLNPVQQDKINFGWFSVADLDAWIEGKGPIPKAAQ